MSATATANLRRDGGLRFLCSRLRRADVPKQHYQIVVVTEVIRDHLCDLCRRLQKPRRGAAHQLKRIAQILAAAAESVPGLGVRCVHGSAHRAAGAPVDAAEIGTQSGPGIIVGDIDPPAAGLRPDVLQNREGGGDFLLVVGGRQLMARRQLAAKGREHFGGESALTCGDEGVESLEHDCGIAGRPQGAGGGAQGLVGGGSDGVAFRVRQGLAGEAQEGPGFLDVLARLVNSGLDAGPLRIAHVGDGVVQQRLGNAGDICGEGRDG